jgi:hypothetical protein
MNINNGIKNFNFLNLNNIDFSNICYKKLFKDGHLSTLILLENHVDFVHRKDDKKYFLDEDTVIKYTLAALYKNKINVCKYFLENHFTQKMCNRLVKESMITKNKDFFMYIIHNYDDHIGYEMIRYCINNSKEIFNFDCYNNFNITNLSHFDGLISSMKFDDLTLFRYYEKFIDYNEHYKNYYHIAFNHGSIKILKYLVINNKIDKFFVKDYYKTMNIKKFNSRKFNKLMNFLIEYKLLSNRKIYKSINKYNKTNDCRRFLIEKKYYDELKSQNKLDLCEKYRKKHFVKDTEDIYDNNLSREINDLADSFFSLKDIFGILLLFFLLYLPVTILSCHIEKYLHYEYNEQDMPGCKMYERLMTFLPKIGFLLKF